MRALCELGDLSHIAAGGLTVSRNPIKRKATLVASWNRKVQGLGSDMAGLPQLNDFRRTLPAFNRHLLQKPLSTKI